MAVTTSNRTAQNKSNERSTEVENLQESPREITHDIVSYLTSYARENPGYAALWCIGVGFVLGWKLKPW